MKAVDLKKTISVAMYIIELSSGISVSRLRLYLIYLNQIGVIKYPKELDKVIFKKIVNSKHVTYINRKSCDLGMVSGLYINDKNKIEYNYDDLYIVSEMIDKFKKLTYDEVLYKTSNYHVLFGG